MDIKDDDGKGENDDIDRDDAANGDRHHRIKGELCDRIDEQHMVGKGCCKAA